MLHPRAFRFVQKVIFAAGRLDGKLMRSGHVVHGIGPDAGGVDNVAGLHHAGRRGQRPAGCGFLNAGDRAAEVEFHPVAHRHLRHGQRIFPRADDGRAGCIQRSGHLRRKTGLHGPCFLCRQQPDARHPIGKAVFVQLLQMRQLRRAEGQHQTAALPVRHIQPGTDLFGQCNALHIEPCHPGARLGVVPSVQNGTVGLGGAVGHIVLGLKNCSVQRIMRELIGGSRANDTAADDCYIQHKNLLIFCLSQHARLRSGNKKEQSKQKGTGSLLFVLLASLNKHLMAL